MVRPNLAQLNNALEQARRAVFHTALEDIDRGFGKSKQRISQYIGDWIEVFKLAEGACHPACIAVGGFQRLFCGVRLQAAQLGGSLPGTILQRLHGEAARLHRLGKAGNISPF